MGDFDLADALDSSSEFGDCTKVQDSPLQVEDSVQLEDGLSLTVSRHRMTMQRVAHLLLAANRLSRCLRPSGHRLDDGELCGAILDTFVEETVVMSEASGAGGERCLTFQRMNSVKECRLRDASQKDVVTTLGKSRLQAVTLKGGHFQQQVNFKMSRYVAACVAPGDGQTVVLSLANNLHISCLTDGDAVSLNVEECSWDALRRITPDGELDRFLFLRRTAGVSLTTFESAKHRGWFISTASDAENQPVEMCRVDAACRLTSFRMT